MMASDVIYVLALLGMLAMTSAGWVPSDQDSRQPSGTTGEYTFPFQDPSLSWEARVNDLVGRMTLQELVNQSVAIYQQPTPAIDRLGIKQYVWITECVHGQVYGNTTSFPNSLGLSAAFDPDLIFQMSTALSYEVRAQWNAMLASGRYLTFFGLNCFSPVLNIARHPLWGRNQETYGEDPYLSGVLASSFVRGLQGSNARYITIGACCKHFDAYAGPENVPVSRSSFSANLTMRDWRTTFLPAFKACVEAGVLSLMCSYNAINGVPSCANKQLLTDILRKEWGFKGYVISDDDAVAFMQNNHHYTNSTVQTTAAALNAGVNMELTDGTRYYWAIPDAIKQNLITEDFFRESMKPLFYTRMRLGEFDPPSMVPFNKINMSVVQNPEHRQLAIRAAQESYVLLKNDNNVLPLAKNKFQKLAIVGPFADNLGLVYGDYASVVVPQFAKSPKEGLANLAVSMAYAPGCNNSDPHCTQYNQTEVKNTVTGADVVVVCVGVSASLEGESNDRRSLDLPGHQLDLLKDAVDATADGVPVILVLFNAGPVDINWAKPNPKVSAIMACFYPGQSVGEALFNVLTATGPHSVPAGRLPMTWPVSLDQIPPITNYTMEGQTYRYFKGDPLYPFGYGLSYTTFKYSNISVAPKLYNISDMKNVTVNVTVENDGAYDADEVVQLYLSWNNASLETPKLTLVDFKRITLVSKAKMEVSFTITPSKMAVWVNDKDGFKVAPGHMTVYAGGQQPGQATVATSNVLEASFDILSDTKLRWKPSQENKAHRHNNVL